MNRARPHILQNWYFSKKLTMLAISVKKVVRIKLKVKIVTSLARKTKLVELKMQNF